MLTLKTIDRTGHFVQGNKLCVFISLLCLLYSDIFLFVYDYLHPWLIMSINVFLPPHLIHTIDYRWKLISKARIMASCNTFLAFYEKKKTKKNNFFFFWWMSISFSLLTQGEKLGDWDLFLWIKLIYCMWCLSQICATLCKYINNIVYVCNDITF